MSEISSRVGGRRCKRGLKAAIEPIKDRGYMIRPRPLSQEETIEMLEESGEQTYKIVISQRETISGLVSTIRYLTQALHETDEMLEVYRTTIKTLTEN